MPGNTYGNVGTVSSPNHTFFLGKLGQAVNQNFVHILSLVTDPSFLESISGREDLGNYFMNNLHESMGPGRNRTATPESAVRHASVVRHVTDCAMRPGIRRSSNTCNLVTVTYHITNSWHREERQTNTEEYNHGKQSRLYREMPDELDPPIPLCK